MKIREVEEGNLNRLSDSLRAKALFASVSSTVSKMLGMPYVVLGLLKTALGPVVREDLQNSVDSHTHGYHV